MDQAETSRSLTPLKAAVMDAALAGDHPVLESLREQLRVSHVRKRELTGAGFFTEFMETSERARTTNDRMWIMDLHADVSGLEHGAGFQVLVERGQLNMLEGFSYDEPWPERITEFTIRYTSGERDVSSLQLG